MYHLSHNSQRNRSREKLYTALVDMIQYRDYEDISIQGLVKKADVSRSTFYRNYQRIDEIFLFKIKDQMHLFSNCLMDYNAHYRGHLPFPMSLIEPSIEFWTKNYKLVECLAKINRLQWLYDEFQANDLFENFEDSRLRGLQEYDALFIKKISSTIVVNTVIFWIASGATESPQHLTELLLTHLFRVDMNHENNREAKPCMKRI